MMVIIPSPLFSYTKGWSRVAAEGSTLGEVLAHLDQRFPGLRFRIIDEQDRIRPHIKFFVRGEVAPNLDVPIGDQDAVQIVCALSGG
jgi:molybdopterin converting factor small subunit